MCDLYSSMKGSAAIRTAARAMREGLFNLAPMPGIFPDYSAPTVRTGADGVREIAMARWGMPSPSFALEGKKTDPGVTNARSVTSPHWRRWLSPENRCLVPFTSFSGPGRSPKGKSEPWSFARAADRPLAFFAGVWVSGWTSVRRVKGGEVISDLFAFLTCRRMRKLGRFTPRRCR